LRIIFAGTPEVSALALRRLAAEHQVALVITALDAKQGRKGEVSESPVAMVARELGLAVLKTRSVGADQLEQITRAQAELAIVVAFGALIREPALSAITWWNLHFSLLPQWRGASPLQQSMLHKTGVGVTVFQITAGLDTGPIIAQRGLDYPTVSFGEALPKFLEAGLEITLAAMASPSEPTPQQGEASLAPKISRADARVHFTAPAEQIERMVRAFNPEPMAWAEFAGEPIRLVSARLVSTPPASPEAATALPGEVLSLAGPVLVRCGDGWLELTEVQPAGKKVMPAADWQRGRTGGHFA
jgi:methionyl-tRNA formyltransferase